jgi:nucleotide-binding universal stress UspA family protein
MLDLAYDASLGADWVSRYGIRLAANSEDKTLRLVHVLDGLLTTDILNDKINAIEKECNSNKIKLQTEILPMRKNVVSTLQTFFSRNSSEFILCGTRMLNSARGYLFGTVSERLLENRALRVLAIRVFQPGNSGLVSDMLMPVSERFTDQSNGLFFLEKFSPQLKSLHLLHISKINTLWFRYLSQNRAAKLKLAAHEYLKEVQRVIENHLSLQATHCDSRALLSDDTAKEIIIQSNKLKSDIVLLGTSTRSLPYRFFYGNLLEQILRQSACDIALYNKGH